LIDHFSPIIPPFANRGLSRRLTWSASGDEWGTKSGVCTINLERLQCARRDSAGLTAKRRRRRVKMKISMEHCWKDGPKYVEKYQYHCHFVHHKSHMNWPEVEPESL
jgi:hypothetical protein